MANETVRLGEHAVGLRYDDLPPQVIQRAEAAGLFDCLQNLENDTDLAWVGA